MWGEGVGKGSVPTNGGENRGSTFRRASDILSQVKPKPDRGFRKVIDDAIAVVEAERRAQRERELAEKNRLDAARQKALMVREIMILPLLNDLATDFATDGKKILPNWQAETSGDADALYGIVSTPIVEDGGPCAFTIKGGASVTEQGAGLSFSVECSCIDAQHLSSGKIRQIAEKTKTTAMAKFDELAVQLWFQEQLKECVRMCVLTRLRHIGRSDAAAVATAVAAPVAVPSPGPVAEPLPAAVLSSVPASLPAATL
jgi:hypothetical protein